MFWLPLDGRTYLINGCSDGHGTKGKWIDIAWDPLYIHDLKPHPWPWPWIVMVNFCNSCISGRGGPIDIERNEYESIEWWTDYRALTSNPYIILTYNVKCWNRCVSGMVGSDTFEFMNIKSVNFRVVKNKIFAYLSPSWGILGYFVVSLLQFNFAFPMCHKTLRQLLPFEY